jgi:hypothetical protein
MRLILHTETGDVFVKGIAPDGGDIERGDLGLGAELAPFVPASPSLCFKGQADGWVFTGWQAVEGRQASMKPGSEDIPLMVGLLAELNFTVQPDRTWMIDLGHAVRGPGWLTSARFILYLMRAGWTAAEAEAVVMDVPAWARADPEQVTAHAVSGAETWYRANNQYPVPQVWRDIIREWAEYRSLSA